MNDYGSYLITKVAIFYDLLAQNARPATWYELILVPVLLVLASWVCWLHFRELDQKAKQEKVNNKIEMDPEREYTHELYKVLFGLIIVGIVLWVVPNSIAFYALPGLLFLMARTLKTVFCDDPRTKSK